MKRMLCVVVALVTSAAGNQVRAADDARAIVAKGIAAMGGEAKLAKVRAMKWRTDGKVIIEGNDNDFSVKHVSQGLDQVRTDVHGDFNGNEINVTIVLDGAKGWRTFPEANALDADAIDNEKRNLYLQVVPITLVPLLDKGFKIEAAGEEMVDDKPASVVKATGPDGKTFRLLFDKTTGLPVRMVATVVGFGGDDYEQVTSFKDYKEMGGIQKATKVDVLRNGDPFLNAVVKEFQVMESLPADTFAEPK